jgi:5-methylcytosine-specific restriction endonuclease McrA
MLGYEMSRKSNNVKDWRNNNKQKMLDAMGGKCQICGYSRCNGALEFHHIDPTAKEIGFGKLRANPQAWLKIIEELKKCILLCSICHKEVHANLTKMPDVYQTYDETLIKPIEKKKWGTHTENV